MICHFNHFQAYGINYIHSVMQLSGDGSTSRSPSSLTETAPTDKELPFFPSPARGNHHSTVSMNSTILGTSQSEIRQYVSSCD